jgi:hypothetical protein
VIVSATVEDGVSSAAGIPPAPGDGDSDDRHCGYG